MNIFSFSGRCRFSFCFAVKEGNGQNSIGVMKKMEVEEPFEGRHYIMWLMVLVSSRLCSYNSRKTFSAVLEKVGMGRKFDTGHTGLSGLSVIPVAYISC